MAESTCRLPEISLLYPVSVMGPLSDWRPQDWPESRGVTGVTHDVAANNLIITCDLDASTEDRTNGDVLLDMKYLPFAEIDFPFDFTGRRIEATLQVPEAFVAPWSFPARPNSVSIFFQDTEFRHYFGPFENIMQSGELRVFADLNDPAPEGSFVHPDFDKTRVRTMGIKFTLNDGVVATYSFSGDIIVKELAVTPDIRFSEPPVLPGDRPAEFVTGEGGVTLENGMFFMDGQRWFPVGGNFRAVEYGQNFGTTRWYPLGNGISLHPRYIAARLDAYRRAGCTLLRIPLLDDGRTLFDRDGHVIGYNDRFKCDAQMFLDLALEFDLKIEFVLLDYLFAAPGEMVEGVWVQGHANVFENQTLRHEFIEDFLVPFLEDFGGHPAWFSLDIANESEWIISKADGGAWEDVDPAHRPANPVSFENFSAFINACTEKLRQLAPEKFITMGLSCPYIGLGESFDLDYNAGHFYPWMGNIHTVLSGLPTDLPWILEEFPSTENIADIVKAVFDAGGQGALIWNLSPGIDDHVYGFEKEALKLNEMRDVALLVSGGDQDQDGIFDGWDRCPDTAPGIVVNAAGCPFIRGDCNLNGRIDMADCPCILQLSAGLRTAADPVKQGDVDCDGSVGPGDCISILKRLTDIDGPRVHWIDDGLSSYDGLDIVLNKYTMNTAILILPAKRDFVEY
jgi:hypothetical protein